MRTWRGAVATGIAALAAMVVVVGCGGGGTTTVTVASKTQAQMEALGEKAQGELRQAKADIERAEATEVAKRSIRSEPTATSIPDGTWASGEFTPGTYRAPGGEDCWWEKLEALGEEVFQPGRYGSEETNILVEIDSRYFKTEECGIWHKVG